MTDHAGEFCFLNTEVPQSCQSLTTTSNNVWGLLVIKIPIFKEVTKWWRE